MASNVTYAVSNLSNSNISKNIARRHYGVFSCESESTWLVILTALLKLKEFFNVTGSRVNCKSGNISETVLTCYYRSLTGSDIRPIR